MRTQLSLSFMVVSLAAAFSACSGGSADSSSSSSGGPSSSGALSSSGDVSSSGGTSSGGTSSGGTSSSSGNPVEPGKPGADCETANDCDDKVCTGRLCQAPTANDGVQNGNESGIDCGQSGSGTNTNAPACGTGGTCAAPTDCVSNNCVSNACVAPTSSDGIRNGNETDVDCGESADGVDTEAAKCADGKTCGLAGDCGSGVCTGGVCQVPNNGDGVKNGNETDIDCGSGPVEEGVVDTNAAACADLAGCLADEDCTSLVCETEICQAPTCFDDKRNGSETDLNCGGASCAPCVVGKACALGRDCDSKVCTTEICQAPTNTDGVQNGNETDVDCGAGGEGPNTNARVCKDTLHCVGDTDCYSGKCVGGACAQPSKNDGVKNGNETAVDCGSAPIGAADPYYGVTVDTQADKCGDALACLADSDCLNNVCNVTCRPKIEGYGDGRQNGNETAVDCGGDGARGAGAPAQGRRCVADINCGVDEDCKSDACVDTDPGPGFVGRCALARSCTMHHGGDTCGTGDELWPAFDGAGEPNPYSDRRKKHESCCASVRVERPAAQGGAYRLDKYPITSGRIRKFLEVLGNGNLDNANVSAWVQAARAMVDAPAQLPATYDAYWPTGWNTPVAPPFPSNWTNFAQQCGGAGQPPCNYGWLGHLSGARFTLEPGGATGYGCYMSDTASGSRTFYLDQDKYRTTLGNETQHLVSKDRTDQRAINCIDYIMLSAFCAWDGGRLETYAEHEYAWGTAAYPWGNEQPMAFTGATTGNPDGPNWPGGNPDANTLSRFLRSNVAWNYMTMYARDRYFWLGGRQGEAHLPEFGISTAQDQSYAVSPPGRYPLGAAANGIRDLSGGQMEITAQKSGEMFRWSKNGSFENRGVHTDNNYVGYSGFQFGPFAKYGRAGGRCARPLDGYPAQSLPKR